MQITSEIIDQFREFFPGIAADNCIITNALTEGDQETSSTRWGSYDPASTNIKRRGMFYFAAHWLLINHPNKTPSPKDGQAANPVASKSVGDESVSYAVITEGLNAADAWLMTTSYGQQYARLRRRVGMGAIAL